MVQLDTSSAVAAATPTPTPVTVQPSTTQKVALPAATGGVVGALVVLITLTLDHFHIEIPAAGTASLMVVLAPIVHIAALRFGLDK